MFVIVLLLVALSLYKELGSVVMFYFRSNKPLTLFLESKAPKKVHNLALTLRPINIKL